MVTLLLWRKFVSCCCFVLNLRSCDVSHMLTKFFFLPCRSPVLVSFFLEGLWNLFHSSFPVSTVTQIFLLILGDHLMVQLYLCRCWRVECGIQSTWGNFWSSWSGSNLWWSHNITCLEKLFLVPVKVSWSGIKELWQERIIYEPTHCPSFMTRKIYFVLPLSLSFFSFQKNFPLPSSSQAP